MKAKALLLVAVISLMGCGGGGKNPIQPPTPPPNNLPTESPTRTTRIIAPIEVLAGESVYVELTKD
ncbi:MAG: hypothetical protein QXP36_15120, partial [Conexivisphaerales archaeon]